MKAAMPEEGLGRYCRKNKDFAAAGETGCQNRARCPARIQERCCHALGRRICGTPICAAAALWNAGGDEGCLTKASSPPSSHPRAAAANLPCGVKGQRPAHWRLLSDLQANFMHRCSGFNAHQVCLLGRGDAGAAWAVEWEQLRNQGVFRLRVAATHDPSAPPYTPTHPPTPNTPFHAHHHHHNCHVCRTTVSSRPLGWTTAGA